MKECEDAISREEAIDACNQSVNILEATDRIKDLPPVCQEPKWIPVSERLPEDKQSVLVWCPQYKNIYCSYREKEQWWIFGAFVQIVPNEIIAWMPLPEPYKAESEDMEVVQEERKPKVYQCGCGTIVMNKTAKEVEKQTESEE